MSMSLVILLLMLFVYKCTPKEWSTKEPHYILQDDKMGFDHIYVINLERRPERRTRLLKMAEQLKLELSFFNATDGRNLTQSKLKELGVSALEGQQRQMTFGEVGCALSHYAVWEDANAPLRSRLNRQESSGTSALVGGCTRTDQLAFVVYIDDSVTSGVPEDMMLKNKYEKVLILEDDALILPMATERWPEMSADLEKWVPDWDFVFLGRRPLLQWREECVATSDFLVWPNYSYWCVAYALSQKGAKKLTNRYYLSNLIPVDEFVPIMYDRHPNKRWKNTFGPRDLIAVSTSPLLIEPAWVKGEAPYVSDTEKSDTAFVDSEICRN